MMLTELSTVPLAALPMQGLRDHLRLGTGFSDDGMQDGLIESSLRAAIAAIEGRIGKALLSRSFRLVLTAWRDPAAQALPLAPVSSIASVTLVEAGGATQVVAPARYRLRLDRHRPRLEGVGLLLPTVPGDGQVEIVFTAGFGASWASLPGDLAQAVLMLAAQFYETRHEVGGARALPMTVQALIETWRNIRVLGGREA
ncbi:head-tail connector protein [Gemmobacter serpentinus]|uniref:head-tail connector protein n=1 Tax=Gemmobacter serpentinus TaxID=2652247 RepID=UPI00124E056A|nr:hypothetical protein [Gemmobacter serpentinus]